jgi:hypothetical protein
MHRELHDRIVTQRRKDAKALVRQIVYDTADAVLDEFIAEIDEQAQALAGQSKIREKLFLVDRYDLFHRLQFEDNEVFDNDVGAISFIEFQIIIRNGNGLLHDNFEPALL